MILNKRVLRDFKSNALRYIALFLIIFLGLFMLIDIASGAETVIHGVADYGVSNNVEDVQFSVFVPLTEENIADIESRGISLEKCFYIDFTVEDGSTLRIFRSRENINIEKAEEGNRPSDDMEIMTEIHNSESKGYHVGGTVNVGGYDFIICGIGTAPDYDAVLEEIGDVGADSEKFGIGFVNSNTYQKLLESGKILKTESYLYSVKLNGKMTSGEFKSYLDNLNFDYNAITDTYIKETLDKMNEERISIETGVKDLNESGKQFSEGIERLNEGSAELFDSACSLTDLMLVQVSTAVGTEITRENYSSVLPEGYSEYITMIEAYIDYENAVKEYSNGANELDSNTELLIGGLEDLQNATDDLVNTFFTADFSNVVSYVTSEKNPRIAASAADCATSSSTCMFAAALIAIICGYMLAVYSSHNINREQSIIGTLYSMGVSKKELMRHYLILPMTITVTACILGTVLGCLCIKLGLQPVDTAAQYSIPDFDHYYPAYLIIYGIFIPPLITLIINMLVIHKKLSFTPCQLLRNNNNSLYSSNVKLPEKMSYISCFRIRQLIREAKIGGVIVLGVFLSSLLLMMSVDTYVMLDNLIDSNKEDLHYSYMYILKYPMDEAPEEGEAVYAESLSCEVMGYDMDIVILGISDDNPYFDFGTVKGKKNLTVSTSVASKYGLSEGDKFILSNRVSEEDYSFTVADIVDYSVGLQVFMDIDDMRELFGKNDDYYNCILSAEELDIDTARIYSTSTSENIIKVSEGFMEQFTGMIYMFIILSVVFFVIVIYLMVSIMIERNARNISIMKIFGYKDGEVRKIYLDSNFVIILVASLISVPLSKAVMDSIMPWFVQHVASGFDISFSFIHYIFIYALIFVTYFLVSITLNRKIKKVTPADILKERDE